MEWLTRIRERREEARAHARAHALNVAIRSLPVSTKQAMLVAAENDDLIAGAYTDGRGGTCPMLAAHRRGARIYARGFPCAWDQFTGARRPRLATQRELDVLTALLQESIADGLTPAQDDGDAAAGPARVLSEL
jgi:hypothetical protein